MVDPAIGIDELPAFAESVAQPNFSIKLIETKREIIF